VNDFSKHKKVSPVLGDERIYFIVKRKRSWFSNQIQLVDKLAAVLNNRNPKLLVAVPS
jgi:hypothetical protein